MNRFGVIVLEGPDGGGKTTLAAELAKHGYKYEHCGPPDRNPLRFFSRQVMRRYGEPLVFDRLHVGSYVYGTIFRGGDDLTAFDHWLLDGALAARAAILVVCRPPDAVLDANLARGPDDSDAVIYEAPEARGLVRALYDDDVVQGHISSLPLIVYDYTHTTAVTLLEQVASLRLAVYGTGEPGLSSWLPADVPALGNIFRPRRILVGDEPGVIKRIERRSAHRGWSTVRTRLLKRRVMTAQDTPQWASESGRYLFSALRSVSAHLPNEMCTFNSRLLDGREIVDFIDTYAAPDTGWVALGRRASERLDRAGIVHETVPHPQHWRRFHYAQMTTYGQLLTGQVRWTGCAGNCCGKGGKL